MTDREITHHLLWFDLETTGLDPHDGRLLEWAIVLADDGPGGTFEPVQPYSGVIHFDHSRFPKMDPCVRNMHTVNGLLSECMASSTTLEESDEFLHGLCRELTGSDKPRGMVLAGGSVHFDLAWSRVHLPRFASCLSHRVFDVSTLKIAERTYGEPFDSIKGDRHRALDDALASLAEARTLVGRRWAQ